MHWFIHQKPSTFYTWDCHNSSSNGKWCWCAWAVTILRVPNANLLQEVRHWFRWHACERLHFQAYKTWQVQKINKCTSTSFNYLAYRKIIWRSCYLPNLKMGPIKSYKVLNHCQEMKVHVNQQHSGRKEYQSTAVTSPSWLFNITGSSWGLFTWIEMANKVIL